MLFNTRSHVVKMVNKFRFPSFLPSNICLIAVVVMVLAVVPARAALQVWDGANGFNWDTTTANWDGGSVWVDGNDASFADTGAGAVTLTEAVTVGTVTFNNTVESVCSWSTIKLKKVYRA